MRSFARVHLLVITVCALGSVLGCPVNSSPGDDDDNTEGEGEGGGEGEGEGEGEGDDPLVPRPLHAAVTAVQPMTGIALWEDNDDDVKAQAGVIQLEYSYIKPSSISIDDGEYDWTSFDDFLDRIADRQHQALVRFYDTYPGEPTAVPDWIKARSDYQETTGLSEG